jgi:transcriptional regulator with XRE-family HTH domain
MDNTSKLRETRTREGLTLVELSHLSGVSEKTLGDIEKGRSTGTQVTRHKILRGMNANPSRSKKWSYKEVFGDDVK